MREQRTWRQRNGKTSWILTIILVFCVLAGVVFSVSQKISREMSSSAIQNLSESLNLIKSTIEAILSNEAEFQTLMAREVAEAENPEDYILSYEGNQIMVKISLVPPGEAKGVSNTGEVFDPAVLDFSEGRTVKGLAVSGSYVNYMGAWSYTMKCPAARDGREAGTLYVEYTYDALDKSLPDGFYNQKAMLYVMDGESERFVLKPKGMGKRTAGHVNLEDYYRANSIKEEALLAEVEECLSEKKNILFYHDIQGKDSLNYMWPVNGGTVFLVGYVPIEAIQQEGRTVNQNLMMVVFVMLAAFLLCCILYFLNQRQQNRARREQEEERELHSQQLAEALWAAQAANSSKTTFLSNMSHDIRTPMNAVLGFTSLLAKNADDPARVREYTRKITASSQHLLGLINDILDISKIESGKVVLNLEPFSLSEVVSSVTSIIQPMARGKNQEFHVEVSGLEHETLVGDETRINQILINLLSNAVKYTQEGGNIWFRILGLKQRSSQYEHIRIEVQDDGFGMTPEYLKTIFDAFTRAENSTTNKVQGTGLGMAITKNIVELMGGAIEVASQVGEGSLFQVELELRIPENQTGGQFWEEEGIRRLLAVSGDPEVRENILMLMKDTGVAIETASDPAEALEQIARAGAPDAVLLDECGQDTAGVVRMLREALGEEVPLLILVSQQKEEEDQLQAANTALLAKPFFVSAFQAKLLELRPRQEKAPELEERGGLEGLRFLAAEDNEINAEILAELLDIEGASCEIVENGRLAVERFESAAEGEFDAILMDVQMPVMNGYEATRAIRALPRADAASIPIIAMTANAFAEDEKAAMDAGMDAHVAKPLDLEMLKRAVRQYLRGKD